MSTEKTIRSVARTLTFNKGISFKWTSIGGNPGDPAFVSAGTSGGAEFGVESVWLGVPPGVLVQVVETVKRPDWPQNNGS